MYKKLFTLLTISLTLFVLAKSDVSALSLPNYDTNLEQIIEFNTKLTINEDGTVDVVEEIDYVFPDQRHGIFRDIPLSKENQDGNAFLMSATGVSVTDHFGKSYKYQNNSDSRQISLKIGDPNKTITGRHQYVISYTLSGAVTYFSDHDEFYWNVTGNDWEIPIQRTNTTIKFPNSIASNTDAICFTGSYGAERSDCKVTKVSPTEIIISSEELASGDGITVVTSFPRGVVSILEPAEDKLDFIETMMAIGMAVAGVTYYAIIPLILIVKALKRRKKGTEEKRVVAAWFDPPKTSGGRDLTAGEVGVLHDRKGDVRDITATLIQLAQKGYFKISSEEKGFLIKKPAFSLIKMNEWLNSDIMPYEIDLLEAIFDGKEVVELSELGKRIGFATKLDNAYKSISAQLVTDGLYEDDPHTHKQKWLAIMFLGFFIFNPFFIIAAYLMSVASRRSALGGTAWATVESMKNFVKTQEKQLDFQAKNQMFFERLLPYATALGVEKVWIERFKDLKLAQPEWLETSNFNTFAYMNLMNSFNSSVSTAVSMSSTRSSSGFSSGFSGGGFSGGGGGGGGGGSW